MKRLMAYSFVFFMLLSPVAAQGLYFDIGLGVGGAWTQVDGNNVSDLFDNSVNEVGVDLGLKFGYGLIRNAPLYFVGTFGAMGHRFDDGSNYLQFNAYLIGPGVIYYPIPLIQLAGSIGYSFIGNQTSLPTIMYKSTGGFAGDISFAIDFGQRNHGGLIGIRYFGAINTLEVSEVKQNSSALSVFFRYAFRQKIPVM